MERVYNEYAGLLSAVLRRGFAVGTGNGRGHFPGLSSPVDIEDAVQECFLRAFSDAGRLGYDGIRPYRNYLFAILKNWVIDKHVRSAHARVDWQPADELNEETAGLGDEAVDRWAAAGAPQEARVEEREMLALLRGLATQLTDTERAVMKLRLLEGLEQTDVAERLGISLYKARSLERRVKKQLTRHLARRRKEADG